MSVAFVRRMISMELQLDGPESVSATIGRITLRPHQRVAAGRLATLIRRDGGALLAEPVGLGKTYTALAAAMRLSGDILIVAPAALRGMWEESLAQCGVSAPIVTHEALSRGARTLPHEMVIVDEAHRLRSPSTRRYAALADLCRRSSVLLVTATPVQNRRNDLAAQLALFLGRRAWEMRDDELSAHVVRGGSDAPPGIPIQHGPHRMALETNDDCLDALLSLPPPVPAKDESIAAALLTYGLIHQWTSSRAALVASLKRRRTRGLALLTALEAGRRPTRAELAAWTHLGDAMQLAFPELVTAAGTGDDIDAGALAIALDHHGVAIESLLARFRSRGSADPDDERAALLRRVRASHPGERIIAFCHYAETVNVLWSKLANDPGVAALTARGARVAGGRVSRDTVIAQLTPPASAARRIAASERIDLVLTTDLLSEGLNLQEASVVVHLDLPWNPARLDQRVGRVRRLGSRHDFVTVYAVAPPASAERLLRIEERLRDKLRVAQRTIGVAGRILPSPIGGGVSTSERGLAEQTGEVHRRLREWSAAAAEHATPSGIGPIVAAVACNAEGFLALVRDDDGARLVADLGSGVNHTPETLAVAVALASGDEIAPDDAYVSACLERIERWLRARRGASAIDFGAATAARSRRAALARVAQAMERTPRHRRAQLAPLADAARAVAIAPLGEGAERILETLVKSELSDEAWLRSIAAFGELNARPGTAGLGRVSGQPRIVAVIAFQPELQED